MAEFPIMPVNVSMLLADTAHMTPLEFGGYCRILFYMWLQRGRLGDDDEELRQIAGVTPKQWRRIRKRVMRPFTIAEGVISQKRLTDTVIRVRETRARRVAAGQKGGRKRWKPVVISGKFGPSESPDFPDKPLK